ncbi:MAG TPA: CARDB domain-containing protein, partial [Candidatus Limnocylindrales bacterium]|nr:CARDB domain-containing protein [Candidatus Limnocylindrales bacterium]
QIDGACGPTGQAVYDAAVVADPEIDYNDYDLDKDGVVDFFMLVFVGKGGNGDSQINGEPAPYDNIWPHSSSLEYSYSQPVTGLKGFVSDDQLKSLKGVPQCFKDATYTAFDACAANGGTGQNDKPVPVRVGPYNVNPESAIDQASVISHEYGHHLGLPDYYSTSYTTYNDWNLMATDFSQNMTVFSKQDLGWVVPEFLQPGETRTVTNWEEIKNDTGEIHWQRPDGTFYTLSSANGDQNIHNGEAFGLKLPRRKLIESSQVQAEASLPNVWYSGRGNDFGCTPVGGHNLDIALPELATVPDGTPITLTFKSKWDIEWDFDYGFTMVTTNGKDYTSLPSAKQYTTPSSINPNNSACQERYGNGITGTSGSYRDSTFAVDRNPASPIYKDSPFLQDEYDLSAYAGQSGVVLRFSYYTDPGLDRPGWFMDDLVLKAGSQTIYSNNFTNDDDVRVFPGGCQGDGGLRVADKCTNGWSLVDATSPSTLDHAYYLELRDRSGFDANGQGQNDRGPITWSAGALIEYTDESRGYGNIGAMPPRQHYIDSQPQPGLDCGEALVDDPLTERNDENKFCTDAAFTFATGDRHFDDNPTGGLEPGDWVDNFSDPASDDGLWHFAYNCLSFDVTSMSGTDVNVALPSNLTANVTISALAGCAPFSYTGSYPNTAPVADAQAKPTTAAVGQLITFDASGSTDDITPSSQLKYEWDLNNDGTYEKLGQVVTGSYSTVGTKTAKLRVTDKSTPAKSSTDTVTVTVSAPKADLTITNHTVSNSSPRQGQQVTFTATVKNIGNATAGASQTQWFLYKANGEQGRQLGAVATGSIAPGASRNVTLTIGTGNLNPGTYRIRVIADLKNVVDESNGMNNTIYFNITVLRR